jgi:hypothetical protein
MLEYEYVSTTLPLKTARGATTCFFAFADTVVAKAFGRKNECHGWMGVKYQVRIIRINPNRPLTVIPYHPPARSPSEQGGGRKVERVPSGSARLSAGTCVWPYPVSCTPSLSTTRVTIESSH